MKLAKCVRSKDAYALVFVSLLAHIRNLMTHTHTHTQIQTYTCM